MKIVTVVGARPQFIKAAAVSRIIRADYAGQIDEVLIHTGQRYDENMSGVYFEGLGIPRLKCNRRLRSVSGLALRPDVFHSTGYYRS